MMIYPRKRMNEKLKQGAVPETLFECSDSGWINEELYVKWFKFFLTKIPPTRPVLLIEDGYSSHISIDVITLARDNGVHLLCLPAHTTHMLQPLDVGVFKSLKSNYSTACKKHLSNHPGQVITTDVLASLLAQAWPESVTPINVMSGFRKCGIHPLNRGQISDRQLAPSNAFVKPKPASKIAPQQEKNEKTSSESASTASVISTCAPESDRASLTVSSSVSTSDVLGDLLALPQPKITKRKRKPGFNQKAVCITDDKVLQDLEEKKEEKKQKKEEMIAKQIERAKKKEQKKKETAMREKKKKGKKKIKEDQVRSNNKTKTKRGKVAVAAPLKDLSLEDFELLNICSESSESEAECPKCGLIYGATQDIWICCNQCVTWFDLRCAKVSKNDIPEEFYCSDCLDI